MTFVSQIISQFFKIYKFRFKPFFFLFSKFPHRRYYITSIFFRLKMPKKMCKNSATHFFFLCYHISKVNFNDNVHFRISLRETLVFLSRKSLRKCRSLRSLNLPLAFEKNRFGGKCLWRCFTSD